MVPGFSHGSRINSDHIVPSISFTWSVFRGFNRLKLVDTFLTKELSTALIPLSPQNSLWWGGISTGFCSFPFYKKYTLTELAVIGVEIKILVKRKVACLGQLTTLYIEYAART